MSQERSGYELRGKRVWVAGHRGLVGSALVRRLEKEDCEILTVARGECDLKDPAQVDRWMADARCDAVFVAAARVGGIFANDSRPATFLYENLMIEANLVEAARKYGVEKLLFLGSSCIYPREAPQPIPESALLTGPLEPTNQWYAIAKIAGVKLCQAYRRQYRCDFISAMPSNLYGPGDNFDLTTSHVAPALIAKAHKARVEGAEALEVWGTGKPYRELLYVDDAADGLVFLMKHYSGEEIVNVGTGSDITIAELARMICRVVGFKGEIRFRTDRPDGTPRKVLGVERMQAMGWHPQVSLQDGLRRTYEWYLDQEQSPQEMSLARA